MRAAGWGRIVNIASAHGLTASPFKSAYVSAKHGLVGLTKTVALELAEEGITCNAICPGYVLTPLVENQIADQMKAHGLPRERVVKEVMLQRQPTREFAKVEDIGARCRLPLLRRRRADHRHDAVRRRRLDRALAGFRLVNCAKAGTLARRRHRLVSPLHIAAAIALKCGADGGNTLDYEGLAIGRRRKRVSKSTANAGGVASRFESRSGRDASQ